MTHAEYIRHRLWYHLIEAERLSLYYYHVARNCGSALTWYSRLAIGFAVAAGVLTAATPFLPWTEHALFLAGVFLTLGSATIIYIARSNLAVKQSTASLIHDQCQEISTLSKELWNDPYFDEQPEAQSNIDRLTRRLDSIASKYPDPRHDEQLRLDTETDAIKILQTQLTFSTQEVLVE